MFLPEQRLITLKEIVFNLLNANRFGYTCIDDSLINVDGERTFDVKVTNFCTWVPIFSVVRHAFVKTCKHDKLTLALLARRFFSHSSIQVRWSGTGGNRTSARSIVRRCLFSPFFSGVFRNSLVDKAWPAGARVLSPRNYF